jgi:hypothetical protein
MSLNQSQFSLFSGQEKCRDSKFCDKFIIVLYVSVNKIYSYVRDFNVITNNPSDVRLEVFTAVTMKNGVFWDVTPCGSCKNRCFEGT